MRLFVITCALSSVVAVSTAWSGQLSSSADVQNVFVGNTIAGKENGKNYLEYFDPSGVIIGEDQEGRYKGKWRVNKTQFCFHYEDDAPDYWDCVNVEAEGPQVTWIDDEHKRTTSKVIPGKPGGW